jgi:hypothetical protein
VVNGVQRKRNRIKDMPISTRRLTEIRWMVSDLLQRGDWERLYNDCGTGDFELARSIANIFAMFDPAHVWKFVDYVVRQTAERRREKRESTTVVCLTLGRIGQSNPSRALRYLRQFLSDDHMLRQSVEASLSNLWIFDTAATRKTLYESWILARNSIDDLQEVAVFSSAYLLGQEPSAVQPFLAKVLRLKDSTHGAAKSAAKNLAKQYGLLQKLESPINGHSSENRMSKKHGSISKRNKQKKPREKKAG